MDQRIEIMPQVWLRAICTDRFKSACLSFSLLRPLRREEAAKNALVANVLLRGTQMHPDLRSISQVLDLYYGAGLGPLVRKNGELQTCGVFLSFMEDRFALPGDQVLEPMLEFLGEVLFQPRLEGGAFVPEFVAGEKQNLINTMEALLNDKRSYADRQMLRAMCREDSFGVSRLGEPEDVAEIDPAALYAHYQSLLAHSPIEIFYAGSATPERVAALLRRVLQPLPRGDMDLSAWKPMRKTRQTQYLEETMGVTQAKLSMGFTTGITTRDKEFPTLMVFNALYGAGVTSKLFVNVRERLSLCYYADSSVFGSKGILAVSSGIETGKYAMAKDEILRQLEVCCAGEITGQELEAAKRAICSSLRTVSDSPGRMEDFAMFGRLSGFPLSVSEYEAAVQAVTADQVAAVARQIRLDTIFLLKGAPV